jgi:hypothetical protein
MTAPYNNINNPEETSENQAYISYENLVDYDKSIDRI